MKKFLKIIALLLIVIIAIVAVFIATFKPARYTDYGMYAGLFSWSAAQFEDRQMQLRTVSDYFNLFSMPLGFPFSKVFGSKSMGVQLKSYEDERISAATISMFELPPGSGYHSVFTLNILPRAGVRAPIMHVDFMKPSPGVSGMFILDFFNAAPDAISYEEFFGDDVVILQQAMAKVEQYQRTEEDGRGDLSRYLDPFKSPYRLELREPGDDDDEARRTYYSAARDAFMLVVPVYLKRVALLQPDQGFASEHEKGMHHLVRELHEKDFAVKMGRNLFKQHFYTYWQDGFWNVNIDFGA